MGCDGRGEPGEQFVPVSKSAGRDVSLLLLGRVIERKKKKKRQQWGRPGGPSPALEPFPPVEVDLF